MESQGESPSRRPQASTLLPLCIIDGHLPGPENRCLSTFWSLLGNWRAFCNSLMEYLFPSILFYLRSIPMKAVELARLGHALVHGASFMTPDSCLPHRAALSLHLDASRQRMEYWSRRFQSIGRAPAWRLSPAIVQEMLVSEILVRVSAAIARIGVPASSPLFEHLRSGHAVVRHQSQQLLRANRLWLNQFAVVAERCCRWTDLLLGQLMPLSDIRDIGFDPDRVCDYASDGALDPLARSLMRDSMLNSLQGSRDGKTGCESLNRQIALSAVSCLPLGMIAGDEELSQFWQHPAQVSMTVADRSARSHHWNN